MAEDFARAVEDGLKLAKRIYLGNDRAVAAPRLAAPMERTSTAQAYLPSSPMVYAVIPDPGIVDNPDLPSYQPHVHGRCDPPALIPLQMNAIELDVDCYLDTALVTVTGTWRVHCVMGSKRCDCRIAVPMGEHGSILGVEVEITRKSYATQLIAAQDGNELEKTTQPQSGGFLKPNIFTLTVPQVDGGTNLSIKMSWSQKLTYNEGEFFLDIPFTFPEYVTPAVKKISKREKIYLSVDAGTGTEVLFKRCSHQLKEKMRNSGTLRFSYEGDVLKWSNTDFSSSFTASSSNIVGGLFLQSAPVHDVDQRDVFSFYLFPGKEQKPKAFKREVVFVVDVSKSMAGKPLEDVNNAISTALSKGSANVIGFSSREHYRAKRKKIGSPDGALRLRDHHISLEWDGNRSRVVSKREQVGLSLRHLREFVDYVPPRRSLLAQVCHVPHETFTLENLSEVLSTEVWQGCLSDGERNYLQQFLPEGIDVEEVVEQLLEGENFHFGNPFLDWGANVCSGKAHPDQIVSQEKCLRAAKRRYYADLENNHNDIIDSLQMLKEKWESCKDPERDAVKMWGRSSEGNANVNGTRHDLATASESSSRDADDKPCNSDRSEEVKRSRPKSSAVEKEKSQSPLIAPENVVNIGVKATKRTSYRNIAFSKLMVLNTCPTLSKKQHQIVASMKQSGKSIQLRALNRILGNIDNLDVQPYGLFVEEEQKKLNTHWLQLVRDLHAAYATWKRLQSQKRDVINSVGREFKDKIDPLMEDKQLHSEESLNPNQSGDLAPEDEYSGSFGQVNAKTHSLSEDSSSNVDQITDSGRCVQVGIYPSEVSSPDCDNGNPEDTEEKQYSSPSRYHHPFNRKDVEANDYSSSIQSHSLPRASFSSEPHPSDLEDTIPVGKNCVPEVEKASSVTSSHGEELQFLSGGDVWQPVGGIRQSYIGHQAYTPSGGLSIIHHPEGGEDEKNGFIHLEEVDGRKMLQPKANNSFGSFPNNNQNELLQSLFKGQGVASRTTTEQLHSLLNVPEHKQIMNIGFQQEGSSNLMEGRQFPGQFQHQTTAPQGLSQDQQRHVDDIYGQGSMSENVYYHGRGLLMQRPDWNTSVAQIGVTTQQPLLNAGPLLNQNWQFKSMWESQSNHTGTTERDLNLLRSATNAEPIIHRGASSDQSLFSVFSQCSQLRRSSSPFEPERSSGNYEMLMGGGTTQVGSSLVQPTHNPLDYLSGSNPVASLMPEDSTWMNNQRRQNSGGLHNPLGKLYPRSWNP